MSEIHNSLENEHTFSLGLICGRPDLVNSEYVVLRKDDIKKVLDDGKTSLTISRMKGERSFRISVGGGRENSFQVKANQLY